MSRVPLIAGLCSAFFALACICCIGYIWWRRYRGHTAGQSNPKNDLILTNSSHCVVDMVAKEELLSSSQMGPCKFSYEELSAATDNFSEARILGVGAFGCVFKGTLPDTFDIRTPNGIPGPHHVAVKRISEAAREAIRNFQAEATIISDLRHRNLVRLRGWGHGMGWLFLVYDYMPNGSLDDILYDEKKCTAELSWERRFKILTDLGSALLYLHEGCDSVVLHRDIKSSNILLDEKFQVKLGDFGLSRQVDSSLSGYNASFVAGTRGYMPLEIFASGRVTKQSDVFSFGAVLAEVASGRRPVDTGLAGPPYECMLLDWMWDLHSKDRLWEAADKRLNGKYNKTEMKRVLIVALACSHPDPRARPTIENATQALQGNIKLPSIPLRKPNPYMYSPQATDSIRGESSSQVVRSKNVMPSSDHTGTPLMSSPYSPANSTTETFSTPTASPLSSWR